MKSIGILVITICLTSCSSKDSLNGYYYMKDSYDIYDFEQDQATVFDILDSITHNITYKILDKDNIKIDDINYHYENFKDSLVIHGFPESYSSKQKPLSLIKFNFEQEISIKDLNGKSWSMTVEKQYEELEKNYKQTQIINIQNNLYTSYIKNNDTVFGGEFENNGRFFNKFIVFRGNYLSNLIPIESKTKEIKFLFFSGFNTNTIFTLNEIEL